MGDSPDNGKKRDNNSTLPPRAPSASAASAPTTSQEANPADDTVRLAFADWMQENGEEDRAEFVRLAYEIAVR